jgi:hypothetical protein
LAFLALFALVPPLADLAALGVAALLAAGLVAGWPAGAPVANSRIVALGRPTHEDFRAPVAINRKIDKACPESILLPLSLK